MSEYEYEMIVAYAEQEWNRLYREELGSFGCQTYADRQKFINKVAEDLKRR